MERGLLGALGIGIALFGAMFVAYFANILAAGGNEKTTPSTATSLVVFFGGLLVVGIVLAWRTFRGRPGTMGTTRPATGPTSASHSRTRLSNDEADEEQPPATPAEREHRILRLAEHERGRVTIPEVAAHCTMTIEESKAELDRLVTLEVAEIQVTQDGVLVYVFTGFLSDQDKARATDF